MERPYRDPPPQEALDFSLARPQWDHRQWWIVLILASCASFALGFWASDRRLDAKSCEVAQRRLDEFLINANAMGIIDHGRLQEAIHAGAEGDPVEKP